MNIYFAGAIRAGRDDAELYGHMVDHLRKFGTVLTEHVGNGLLLQAEQEMSEEEIYIRDMAWLELAEVVIAEVSTPSLGVGYEIARAESLGKKIFCLYRHGAPRCLSAMIKGNSALAVASYRDLNQAQDLLSHYLQPLTRS